MRFSPECITRSRATDEAAARISGGAAEAAGGTVASVENYEVIAGPIRVE